MIRRIMFAALVSVGLATSACAQQCDQIETLLTLTPSPMSWQLPWKVWLEKLATLRSGEVDLLIFGDSLAQGWDQKSALSATALNLGVLGDLIRNALWRLNEPKLAHIKPKRVLLMLGTNDLGYKRPACAIIAGLTAVIDRTRAVWPSAKIFVLETPPYGDGFRERNTDRTQVNAALRKILDIRTINVDDQITCAWTQPCANYVKDNIHFSPQGYTVLKALVQPMVFGD